MNYDCANWVLGRCPRGCNKIPMHPLGYPPYDQKIKIDCRDYEEAIIYSAEEIYEQIKKEE